MSIVDWKDLNQIVTGCGGVIYNILNNKNSGVNGVELAMCIFSPSETAVLHYHKNMEEIYYILAGQGEIELDGVPYALSEETAVFIKPNTKHRIRNLSATTVLKFLSINSPIWDPEDMVIV